MRQYKFAAALAALILAACSSPSAPAPDDIVDSVPAEPTLTECESNPPTDDIGIYHCSWAHRALTHQRQLGLSLPFREIQIPSSHNSYNSSVYPGLSSTDLNQTRSLVDQLQLDMRSIELDVHWYPHTASGGHAPLTCHGLGAGQDHFGCTAADRHLNKSLDEIVSFLESPQGQDQVLFIDIENSLSPGPLSGQGTTTEEAHAAALAAITEKLGAYIYQPLQNGVCQATPMDLTQQQMLDAGKNILLNAPCTQAGWSDWAFEVNSARPGQKAHTGFSGYPDCDSADFDFAQYRERWVREWEDTTQLGAGTNPNLQRMSDQNLQDMNHCGLSFASLDRVDPNPPAAGAGNPTYVGQGVNFDALVWSWAVDKPAINETLECAQLERANGRFHDTSCETAQAHACLSSSALNAPITDTANLWVMGSTAAFGQGTCPAGYQFDVPRNGWLKQTLVERMDALGVDNVWVNFREAAQNTWQPL